MAGLGTTATTAIITRGISGQSACRGLITTQFSLYYFKIEVIIPTSTNGGSRVFQQGEIQNFYKPVPPEQQYYVTRDQEYRYNKADTKMVTVKLVWNEKETEKVFAVSDKNVKALVQAINVFNNANKKIKVAINSIKSLANRAKITIKNLRKK